MKVCKVSARCSNSQVMTSTLAPTAVLTTVGYTAPKHISLQRDNYIVTKQHSFWHTRLEFKPKEVTMKISAMCIMRFDRETPEPVLLHICHDVSEHGWFQRSTYALRAPSAYPPLPYLRCSSSNV